MKVFVRITDGYHNEAWLLTDNNFHTAEFLYDEEKYDKLNEFLLEHGDFVEVLVQYEVQKM